MEKIIFQVPDSNETVEFYVLEETKINGFQYLLVTEEEDGDSDAYILKDVSKDSEADANYVMVEEDDELEYMSKIFASILEDIDFTME